MIDKRTLKTHIACAGGLAAALGMTVFLTAPGKAPKKTRAVFYGRNYAHRGLHRIDRSVPENSIPAFEAAAKIGYGIELDVHITLDDHIVVFHDDNLERVCGVEGRIEDMTLEQLSKLRLCGTQYRIPLLSEALGVIRNRCPVIVELKRGPRNRELCKRTCDILRSYGGRCCVESFDPRIVMWFRLHAPEILRGQLASEPSKMAEDTSKLNAFMVGNLLTNFLARPQFIAYEIGKKPLTVRLCEALGAMRVAWTSREWKTEEKNDAVIFQFYRPRVKYK